jgi:hypothetical protein
MLLIVRITVTMILSTLVLCFFLVFVEARSLPFLKLPYGTWQASSFDEVAKVKQSCPLN